MTIDALERRMASQFERDYCLLVGSGTTALYASFCASGLSPDATVLYPDFTCETAFNAAIFAGLNPVFCDIESERFNMSAAAARAVCTADAPAAIVPTHIFGHRMNIAEIAALAGPEVSIIEDSAQSYGGTDDGRLMSGEARASVISTGEGKLLSCSGGGAILADDERFVAECRKVVESLSMGSEEQANERRAVMTGIVMARRQADASIPLQQVKTELLRRHKHGYLSKLSDAQAESISVELEQVEQIVARRIEETLRLDELLGSIAGLQLPVKRGGETPWRYCFLAPERDRDRLFEKLAAAAVPLSKLFDPCHRAFDLPDSEFPNACSIAERVINIKYPLAAEDFERLYESLQGVMDNWRLN